MTYEHTQTSSLPYLILISYVVFFVVVAVNETSTAYYVVSGIVFAVLVVAALLMTRLTVTLEADSARCAFGWGWPWRSIAYEQMSAVHKVRNRWWYGLGIRRIPHGWLFSIWGLDAVEVQLRSGSVFRFGTDEPDALLDALSARLSPVES